jgi:hypothetical protein
MWNATTRSVYSLGAFNIAWPGKLLYTTSSCSSTLGLLDVISSLLVWGTGYREGRAIKVELHKFGCSKGGGYWPRDSSIKSYTGYTIVARRIE